jgi:hypothetical protein
MVSLKELLRNVLEKMYGSSNNKRSSSSAPENSSSSSTHFDQKEQSSVQKEELNSASLGKPDAPVFQTGLSGFGRIENILAEEDDCST